MLKILNLTGEILSLPWLKPNVPVSLLANIWLEILSGNENSLVGSPASFDAVLLLGDARRPIMSNEEMITAVCSRLVTGIVWVVTVIVMGKVGMYFLRNYFEMVKKDREAKIDDVVSSAADSLDEMKKQQKG